MIKVNLLKEQKSRSSITAELSKLRNLKTVKVEDLLKVEKSVYYVSPFLWLIFLLSGLYYFKLSNEKIFLSGSIEDIKARGLHLQARRQGLLETEKQLQENIRLFQAKIQDIDRSKDILINLKSYYSPFKNYMNLYTTKIPSTIWVHEYKQVVDLNNNLVSTEIKFSSLDPKSIGSYGNLAKIHSLKYYITSVERNVGQHGFAYYSANLNVESPLIQEGKP